MNEVIVLGIFLFILGAAVGSFLNVCIVRMPLEKSIVHPGSHCPACQKPIAWFDNIPLISIVVLRARCRHCGQKFSWRYFVVELITATAFLVFYLYFGLSPILWAYLFMMSCFIVATFVDLSHRIIPDQISLGGMLAGIVFSGWMPTMHDLLPSTLDIGRIVMWSLSAGCILFIFLGRILKKEKIHKEDVETIVEVGVILGIEALLHFAVTQLKNGDWQKLAYHLNGLDAAFIGFMVGGGATYFMGLFGEIIFKKEAMGGGDVKLMAMIGAFLGWKLSLLTFFIAPFFGAVVGIVELIRTKDRTIAYGPFLALGAIISLFWGQHLLRLLLRMYGLN